MAKKSVLEREKKKHQIFLENFSKRFSLKNQFKKEKDINKKTILYYNFRTSRHESFFKINGYILKCY